MTGLRGKRARTKSGQDKKAPASGRRLRYRRVDILGPEHLRKGELTIVVFGPGRGEAILVYLPDGSCGIVDGCRERDDPMLALLHALDEAEDGNLRMRFVCLTHPHDDHYAGLGRLLQTFEGRVDCVWKVHETGDRYADAYIKYTQLTRRDDDEVPDHDALKGLELVFAEMRREHSRGRPDRRTVERGMKLLEHVMEEKTMCICAVAPSRRDLDIAHEVLSALLLDDDRDDRARTIFDPNRASGALLIQWGNAKVLLTGDLLSGGAEPLCGWNCAAAEIDGPVQVVKVAHHGSAGAHHDELWQKMQPQLAIVTPFKDAAGSQPPRPEDIERLVKSGTRVVITSPPAWHRDTSVVPPPKPVRRLARNSVLALSLPPERRPATTRNAVAVSLGPDGTIRQCLLAGEANEY